MIIGHIGAAFGARRAWPQVSMKVLLPATFAPDLVRFIIEALGVPTGSGNAYTHVYPWSFVVVAGVAAMAWLVTRQRHAAIASAVLVLAHLLFDMVSGTKALWRDGPRGWNLDAEYWQYEMVIECALLVTGWLLMRPVVGSRWRRASLVVELCMLEFAMLSYGIYQRPYLTRCWIYPFKPCDDNTPFSHRWFGIRLPFGL